MRTLVPVLSLLALSLPMAAADTPVQYVNRRSNVLGLSNVADPAAVASAALFSTNDGGQSWQLVEEVAAPADGRSFPRFTFTVPRDGTYGLYSRTVYRTGHREADPRPGMGPLYVLVVDSTPPSFSTAEAQLIGNTAGRARFHAVWALVEDNPGDPPVTIEVLAADGRFLPVGTGSAKGAVEFAESVPANATTMQVRFSATDRAGNTTHSPPVALPLTPPPLNGAAREALAQAVKEMPSLADLGVATATRPVKAVPAPVETPRPRPPKPPVRSVEVKAPTPAPAPSAGPEASLPPPLPPAATADAPAPPPAVPAASDAPPPIPAASDKTVADGQRAAPPKLAYVSGSQADDLLRDARVAVRFDRIEDALDFYDRVLSSSRSEDGIHDLVHLLTRLRRPLDLCTLVDSLPPEYHDDQVRLEHGRALVRLHRHAEAEQVLNGIGSRSLEAREARYLIAVCWRVAGREADAVKMFTHLTKGDDEVAGWARGALAGR